MDHVGSGGMVASDASSSIAGAAASRGIPKMPGAKHAKEDFVAVKKVQKKNLPARVQSMLSRQSTGSHPSAVAAQKQYKVVQGDNLAEYRIGGVKNKLRKVQLKGRSAGSRSTTDMLYAAFVLRTPGLGPVLRALKAYRREGILSCRKPASWFNAESINSWLKLKG